MKYFPITKLTFILLGIAIFSKKSFSKAILIPVDEVFKSVSYVKEIKVLEYVGDTVMVYCDLKTNDTLRLECKWKKYSESSIRIIKENNPDYSSWEGTFPKRGEVVTMLWYKNGRNRVLFARKEKENLRFWDPLSIPFANSVFYISKNSSFKLTAICKSERLQEDGFYCSDGFLVEEKLFKKLTLSKRK